MRKLLVLLAGALLCPVLAGAQVRQPRDLPDYQYLVQPLWVGAGFGGGKITSRAPAPSAGRDAFSFSFDAGIRITPQWGAGFEFGMVGPNGGCGGHHCGPSDRDFAPDFSHWFLMAEHRSRDDDGLRLRAGIGVSSMCYDYYRTSGSSFGRFLEAVFFEDDYDDDSTHWDCKSIQAFGASVSVGYQLPVSDDGSSIGLQLRGEAANFAASGTAGTPRFRHRAITLQIQLNIN
jgi:hypothetical protein